MTWKLAHLYRGATLGQTSHHYITVPFVNASASAHVRLVAGRCSQTSLKEISELLPAAAEEQPPHAVACPVVANSPCP